MLETLTALLPHFIFYILSAILVISALGLVTGKNPVHSALWLILAFFTASGHWLLLQSEFLAITLVLVYVGAVMVLFLFVVMMLDIDVEEIRKGFWRYFPMAALVALVMIAELALVYASATTHLETLNGNVALTAEVSNTRTLGLLIYTQYLLPFELAAVVLLLAMVAAIALTMRKRTDTQRQNIDQQVAVSAKNNRLRIVKMIAVTPIQADGVANLDALKKENV
ncbi:MAG: NADH-quinone oxidoreductase subunit J [Neisseriaceae bacterium]|nr:NADH-quinone oxidoreductase subunit J [Neisseriaceae bacterium]